MTAKLIIFSTTENEEHDAYENWTFETPESFDLFWFKSKET
jgi:hypothetical protein